MILLSKYKKIYKMVYVGRDLLCIGCHFHEYFTFTRTKEFLKKFNYDRINYDD